MVWAMTVFVDVFLLNVPPFTDLETNLMFRPGSDSPWPWVVPKHILSCEGRRDYAPSRKRGGKEKSETRQNEVKHGVMTTSENVTCGASI